MTFDPLALHKEYEEYYDTWQTCRDAATGQRAVHAGGEKYLPKLSGQNDLDYKAYLKRALYFNATGRTVEGMVGLCFRKQPTTDLPPALEAYVSDINLSGESLEGFSRNLVEAIIKTGRAGILVDYPPQPELESALTVEQARVMGQRPYISSYSAESIRNWRLGRVGNVHKLINLSLSESYENEDGETKTQIRELSLEPKYVQRVWREVKTGKDAEWAIYSEHTPTINGQSLEEIPFFFVAPKEADSRVQSPPIESLAYVNIAHYRNSADLENGAHVAGQPTPWVNGITDPENFPTLHLGSNTFLKLPLDAEAGFLQCGSEGFSTLEKAMDRKEEQMAALGARMLAGEKKQAETAEALEIKRGGESSVLASLVGSVEMTISAALKFMALWVGANPEEVRFELNKDFLPYPMDAQMLTAWVSAWQSGGFSYETFIGGLQRGELIPETVTAEDEAERIGLEPALGMINEQV